MQKCTSNSLEAHIQVVKCNVLGNTGIVIIIVCHVSFYIDGPYPFALASVIHLIRICFILWIDNSWQSIVSFILVLVLHVQSHLYDKIDDYFLHLSMYLII